MEEIDQKRLYWLEGVRLMAETLAEYPNLPLPAMATDSTFIALMDGHDERLFPLLRDITRLVPSERMPVQEHYNWTTPKMAEMDRLRLVYMFGACRYEIDAPLHEVFGDRPIGPISDYVQYIGYNVNTMHIPNTQTGQE